MRERPSECSQKEFTSPAIGGSSVVQMVDLWCPSEPGCDVCFRGQGDLPVPISLVSGRTAQPHLKADVHLSVAISMFHSSRDRNSSAAVVRVILCRILTVSGTLAEHIHVDPRGG